MAKRQTRKTKEQRKYVVDFEQINCDRVTVSAANASEAASRAMRKWRQDTAVPQILQVAEIDE